MVRVVLRLQNACEKCNKLNFCMEVSWTSSEKAMRQVGGANDLLSISRHEVRNKPPRHAQIRALRLRPLQLLP